MFPTFDDGQEILVDKKYYQKNRVQKNEVIVAKLGKRKILKRVVGIENDEIKLEENEKGCFLFVNQKKQNRIFSKRACKMFGLYIRDYKGKIPEKSILVLGDNPESKDSAHFGLLSEAELIGRVKP